MSASRAVSVRNSSTTTRKSSARKARSTVGVSGFCGIGLPRSTQAMRSGGSHVASMCGPEQGRRDRHADDAVRLLRRVEVERVLHRAEDLRPEVGEDPAGARLPDVPGEGEQRDHRAHRLAAVRVALHAEAGADRRRRHGAEELGEPLDLRLRHARDLRGPGRRPRRGRCSRKASKPWTCRPTNGSSTHPRANSTCATASAMAPSVPGRGCRSSAARSAVSVRRGSMTTSCPPAVERLLHERHLVDVRLGRVLAPEDDEPRVGEVPGRVVLVVAEREARRLEPGGPAQVAVGRRAAAEEPPERRGDAVQQALRAARGVEEDRLRRVAERTGAERRWSRGPRPSRRAGRPRSASGAAGGGAGRASRRARCSSGPSGTRPLASRRSPGAPRSAAAARPRPSPASRTCCSSCGGRRW